MNRKDLLGRRRLRLLPSLARQLHRETVARGVVLTPPAREVENHRERTDGLADRLALETAGVQPGDESSDVGGLDRMDVAIAKTWEDAPQVHTVRTVRRRCALGDVDA